MNIPQFPYTVVFNAPYGQRTFATPSELLEWLENENEAYQGFVQPSMESGDQPALNVNRALSNLSTLRNVSKRLQQLANDKDWPTFESRMKTLAGQLIPTYRLLGLPPSDAFEVRAVQPILKADPVIAVATLFAMFSPEAQVEKQGWKPKDIIGFSIAAAIRFRIGEDSVSSAFNESMNIAINSMKLRADETHAKVTTLTGQSEEIRERLDQAWSTHKQDYDEVKESLRTNVTTAITNADKEIVDFKTGHIGEIALKAPVEYWAIKGRKHQTRANLFALASVVIAGCAGVAAWCYFPILLKPAQAAAAVIGANIGPDAPSTAAVQALAASPGGGAPTYFGIAVTIVLTTMILWLLRILVRGYLSQTHLATDADERVAMVKTYLALMESGRAPADTLSPVLVALFRPASDGIVKDDSMPAGLANILSQQKS